MSCFFSISYNATVSLDGKGDYTTIGAAIAAAPNNSDSRFIIYVKPRMYFEYIKIESSKTFITLKDDDASTTTIVGNRSQANGFGTADSATFRKLAVVTFFIFYFFYHFSKVGESIKIVSKEKILEIKKCLTIFLN